MSYFENYFPLFKIFDLNTKIKPTGETWSTIFGGVHPSFSSHPGWGSRWSFTYWGQWASRQEEKGCCQDHLGLEDEAEEADVSCEASPEEGEMCSIWKKDGQTLSLADPFQDGNQLHNGEEKESWTLDQGPNHQSSSSQDNQCQSISVSQEPKDDGTSSYFNPQELGWGFWMQPWDSEWFSGRYSLSFLWMD